MDEKCSRDLWPSTLDVTIISIGLFTVAWPIAHFIIHITRPGFTRQSPNTAPGNNTSCPWTMLCHSSSPVGILLMTNFLGTIKSNLQFIIYLQTTRRSILSCKAPAITNGRANRDKSICRRQQQQKPLFFVAQ